MLDPKTSSLVASAICLGLITLCSAPHLSALTEQCRTAKRKYEALTNGYEDEDGIASEESLKKFSDLLQRSTLIAGSAAASAIAIVSADLVATRQETAEIHSFVIQQWLQVASWIAILVQSINIFLTPSSVQRSSLGGWTALSSLLLALAIPAENFTLWLSQTYPQPYNLHATFSVSQFVLALTLLFTGLSIPRRPDVFKDGKPVEREYTVSKLDRLTFSWSAPVLEYAIKNRKLTTDDLPIPAHDVRARTLLERFDAAGKQDALWKQIFYAFRGALLVQWTLQFVASFTNFLPQTVLYIVLRLLESRDRGAHNQTELWLAAVGLGLGVGLGIWIETLLFYTCFLKLGTPLYEQLSAAIFAKAIRKKDVKSAAKVDQDAEIKGETTINTKVGPNDEDTAVTPGVDQDEDDEEVTKSKQSTINLIGVDSKRISAFATYNYIFLGSTMKIILAIFYLSKLVGWIPTLCGFAVPVIISPLNWAISKRYGDAQDDLMKFRDQKMAVVSEALQGIRQIKFSALEKDWYEKILKTRRKELKQQWRAFYLDSMLISIWIFGPVCMSAVTLATYALINGGISASVAFTTLAIFEAIEMTLAVVPEMITDLLDALISARRIQIYLNSAEIDQGTVDGDSITFQGATISWPTDEQDQDAEDRTFTLEDLNINFRMGELNVVSGKTGSGKSLLLSAIIGEADILEGKVTVPKPPPADQRYDSKANFSNWIIPGSIAYVSQIPWIENSSLRDNILFGLPFDQKRYNEVVAAAALEKDLEMLQDGDMTDIGANGINLSGGQKWRTSFARSLYSRASILVLDDIFSAVDAHVGRQLFENALTGTLCQGRTRILVTHHVALCLPATKYLVLLGEGKALRSGTVEELRALGHLAEILAHDVEEQKKAEQEAEMEEALTVDDGGHDLVRVGTAQSRGSRRLSSQNVGIVSREAIVRQISHATIPEGEEIQRQKSQPKKFTEEENREVGSVSFTVYRRYIKACRGYLYWSMLLGIFLSWIVIFLGRSLWISHWTRQYETRDTPTPMTTFQSPSFHQVAISVKQRYNTLRDDKNSKDTLYYVGVYLGISLCAWIVGTTRYFTVYLASIRGSKVLFEKLTNAILRAPLRFLDTTPVGRITNRFTADFNLIDSSMANDLGFMLHCMITTLSVIIAGFFISPYMLLFALALIICSGYFASRFLKGAREVKRLESNSKSPIFEQFGSVLSGIATIRAFDKTESYLQRMFDKINVHCACDWHVISFNRWMSFRSNMLGALFNFCTAALIVSLKGVDASLAGFVLSFSLELSDSINWALRLYTNVQLNFNAVERVIEYSDLTIEDQGGQDAPAAWPTKGTIDVDNLVVSYAKDLSPVLKNLTFSVNANERVGVVGRTGAGKSSLTLALFRFLEAQSGSITIDGIDVSKIKLYDLRSRLAIIPQDPVLFSGTVRSNLDPFDQHTDAELRDAMARVHLIDPALMSTQASGTATPVTTGNTTANSSTLAVPGTSTPTNTNTAISLSTRIAESGLNLSQGQRQLLCLARAIVSKPRILVLDEATSSVDMETDKLIQQSIREEFGGRCTLIVIAHRLSTIADFDRILVLGAGQVLEYDTPRRLYESSESKEGGFKEMVEKSGEKSILEEVILGKTEK